MAYSTTYTDERGSSVPVFISDEESREAIRNDWNVLRGMFNPRYVTCLLYTSIHTAGAPG